jgi:hypothetical protein
LIPVLANAAEAEGLVGFSRFDDGSIDRGHVPGLLASDWVVMARSVDDLGGLTSDRRWQPRVRRDSLPLWTDDYSSLIRVIRKLACDPEVEHARRLSTRAWRRPAL